ncbi:MAG TPA: polysaccharide biosynthesis/export family protein [Thermoanaerobaculia bacterium]|nr:polysaccharide biosynthesis/export family protein [Thermoanaerobaculia bacterium]
MKKIASYPPVLLALLLLGAAAAAQPAKAPGYRIGPRDMLDIKVFEMKELDGPRRVSEDGSISLPLIGDVQVAGQTESELTASLKALLDAKYAQRATVEVKVTEFRSRPITVLGAVTKPGSLAFSGRWTLLEALTAAGGVASEHGTTLYVLRRADNGLSDQVTIDVDDLLVRADPRVNIPLLANDLINVPGAVEVTVYCLGQVAHPGAMVFKGHERVTLLAAIARAGGLTDRAARKILVKRAEAPAGTPEIVADYKRIIAGKDADLELHQGDVLVVKESFF